MSGIVTLTWRSAGLMWGFWDSVIRRLKAMVMLSRDIPVIENISRVYFTYLYCPILVATLIQLIGCALHCSYLLLIPLDRPSLLLVYLPPYIYSMTGLVFLGYKILTLVADTMSDCYHSKGNHQYYYLKIRLKKSVVRHPIAFTVNCVLFCAFGSYAFPPGLFGVGYSFVMHVFGFGEFEGSRTSASIVCGEVIMLIQLLFIVISFFVKRHNAQAGNEGFGLIPSIGMLVPRKTIIAAQQQQLQEGYASDDDDSSSPDVAKQLVPKMRASHSSQYLAASGSGGHRLSASFNLKESDIKKTDLDNIVFDNFSYTFAIFWPWVVPKVRDFSLFFVACAWTYWIIDVDYVYATSRAVETAMYLLVPHITMNALCAFTLAHGEVHRALHFLVKNPRKLMEVMLLTFVFLLWGIWTVCVIRSIDIAILACFASSGILVRATQIVRSSMPDTPRHTTSTPPATHPPPAPTDTTAPKPSSANPPNSLEGGYSTASSSLASEGVLRQRKLRQRRVRQVPSAQPLLPGEARPQQQHHHHSPLRASRRRTPSPPVRRGARVAPRRGEGEGESDTMMRAAAGTAARIINALGGHRSSDGGSSGSSVGRLHPLRGDSNTYNSFSDVATDLSSFYFSEELGFGRRDARRLGEVSRSATLPRPGLASSFSTLAGSLAGYTARLLLLVSPAWVFAATPPGRDIRPPHHHHHPGPNTTRRHATPLLNTGGTGGTPSPLGAGGGGGGGGGGTPGFQGDDTEFASSSSDEGSGGEGGGGGGAAPGGLGGSMSLRRVASAVAEGGGGGGGGVAAEMPPTRQRRGGTATKSRIYLADQAKWRVRTRVCIRVMGCACLLLIAVLTSGAMVQNMLPDALRTRHSASLDLRRIAVEVPRVGPDDVDSRSTFLGFTLGNAVRGAACIASASGSHLMAAAWASIPGLSPPPTGGIGGEAETLWEVAQRRCLGGQTLGGSAAAAAAGGSAGSGLWEEALRCNSDFGPVADLSSVESMYLNHLVLGATLVRNGGGGGGSASGRRRRGGRVDVSPVDAYPTLCTQRWEGVDVWAYAFFSALAYLPPDEFPVGVAFYNSIVKNRTGADWRVRYSAESEGINSASFFDVFSPSRNLSIIASRGTNPISPLDYLQNIALYYEVGLYHFFASVIPFFTLFPQKLVIDAVHLSSRLELVFSGLFGSPKREVLKYYWEHVMGYAERRRAAGYRVALTGHSLGGAIAKIVGSRLGMRGISFHGPGIVLAHKKFGIEDVADIHRYAASIVPENDMVPTVDKLGGAVYNVLCASKRHDTCHLMESSVVELWNACPTVRDELDLSSVHLEFEV